MSGINPNSFLGKVRNAYLIYKQSGGILKHLHRVYKFSEIGKFGTCVGTDKYGNKYFENKFYFYGRDRWVEYAPHVHMDFDASQIPAEWFGWMHHKTDLIPTEDPHRPKYKWMSDHSQNLSGTPDQYMPFTTVKPKIQAWQPPKAK